MISQNFSLHWWVWGEKITVSNYFPVWYLQKETVKKRWNTTWMSQEIRIKGDRISGFCGPPIYPIYKDRWNNITHWSDPHWIRSFPTGHPSPAASFSNHLSGPRWSEDPEPRWSTVIFHLFAYGRGECFLVQLGFFSKFRFWKRWRELFFFLTSFFLT